MLTMRKEAAEEQKEELWCHLSSGALRCSQDSALTHSFEVIRRQNIGSSHLHKGNVDFV